MWDWIKRLFGFVEHEIEDIVDDFHKAITKLDALVARKNAIADAKVAEAAKAQAAADAAKLDASDAGAISDNLAKLVVRPSQQAVA
jgi:hypothetical protein